VHDLFGLVWEWVLDFNSAMLTTDARNAGTKDSLAFCGGGAINATDKANYPSFMRVAFRSSLRADYTTNNLGFRCAADDEEVPR
jgi:formylglycine-generating enzyme required for sulfatase activity